MKNGGLALLVNPQWNSGQFVSDFGFGTGSRELQTFVATFEDTYFLKQQRVQGEELFILRAYPGELAVSPITLLYELGALRLTGGF